MTLDTKELVSDPSPSKSKYDFLLDKVFRESELGICREGRRRIVYVFCNIQKKSPKGLFDMGKFQDSWLG